MKLSVLAQDVFDCTPFGDLEISQVTDNSTSVVPGALFVAIPGGHRDGRDFIPEALEKGAVAVLSPSEMSLPVPLFRTEHPRRVFALLCGNFYGNPAESMILTGITGTNGKTSTAYMLDRCLQACGKKSCLLGTVSVRDGNSVQSSSLTTPEPPLLHGIFARAKDHGCTHGVMEVSSQSLDQSRVAGLAFQVGIFTNLTVDHLDYHGSMQAYRDAKLKLFSQCRQGLVNADSDYAAPFLALPHTLSYSASHRADFSARRIYMTGEGVSYLFCSPSGQREVFLPAWGRFSIYNSLATLSAAELLGLDADACISALSSFPGVPGRMEVVRGDLPFRLLIDYAHTPDGLENVLSALRESTRGRLTVLFGCGGDRDAVKRPEMGRIATLLADRVIITSDNPRTEDPDEIIRQIVSGATGDGYTVIPHRTEAIRHAIRGAGPGDTVLLAGKGHETRQIFSHGTVEYDEREIAREILKEEGY